MNEYSGTTDDKSVSVICVRDYEEESASVEMDVSEIVAEVVSSILFKDTETETSSNK